MQSVAQAEATLGYAGIEEGAESAASETVNFGGTSYRLSTARDSAAIMRFEVAWEKLAADNPAFSYFQSFDWCAKWAEHCCDVGTELRVFLLERDQQPAIIWPMMITRSSGMRVLTTLTEPLGQYGNMLVDETLVDVDTGKALLDHLQSREKADLIQFSQYPEGSFLDRVIGGNGFGEAVALEASLGDLTTFENWDAYMASLGKRSRRQRNQRRNKLNRSGDVSFDIHMGGTAKYRELVAEALTMKARWLEETGRRSDNLISASTKDFLCALKGEDAKGKDEAGDLPGQGAVLQVLNVDGKPVGIEIGMIMGRHYYAYLGAFDWDWNEYSVGKIQMEATQQWALETGIHTFDFLGDPSAYKSNWTQKTQPLKNRNLPLTAKGFIYAVIWRGYVRPTLKSAYSHMGTSWRKRLGFLIGFAEKMRSGGGEKMAMEQKPEEQPAEKS